MITRAEYMRSGQEAYKAHPSDRAARDAFTASAHHAYFAQFVTLGITRIVRSHIGTARIVASSDPHLNDIPLACWDALHPIMRQSVNRALLRDVGEGWSLGTSVCIAKVAARMIQGAERMAKLEA